jgi:hypothetical protein
MVLQKNTHTTYQHDKESHSPGTLRKVLLDGLDGGGRLGEVPLGPAPVVLRGRGRLDLGLLGVDPRPTTGLVMSVAATAGTGGGT